MSTFTTAIHRAHRFLAMHSFYPLVLASLLACGLLAGRIYLTRTHHFIFLIWNLFLAWIPYMWSMWAAAIDRRYPGAWWRLILPGSIWLIFFPNAPYIITDLIHLQWAPQQTLLYDAGMVAAFAWSGCFLGVASLRAWQNIVERYAGWSAGWIFAILMVGLGGLGVYIGRFLRWNSWDLLLNPGVLLADVLERAAHIRAAGMTAIFAALLLVCYLMFTLSRQRVDL
ncbi:MAG: hypothetical protein KatS3mg057_1385 [Herpetosiphonaceae bacterium]|nr:MAG: hypothetical protein KatS3mg057_1385 [Herpetosiphonaceae bacterium]